MNSRFSVQFQQAAVENKAQSRELVLNFKEKQRKVERARENKRAYRREREREREGSDAG